MPATNEYNQGGSFLGRISIRRNQVVSMEGNHEQELEDIDLFQKNVAERFSDLLPPAAIPQSSDSSSTADHHHDHSSSVVTGNVLSIAWLRKLLDNFLCCEAEFKAVLIMGRDPSHISKQPLDRLIPEMLDRSVKALDVCNAITDGLESIRHLQKLAEIVVDALEQRPFGEGQVRRAKRALDVTSDLNSPESVYRASVSTESLRYPNEAINFRYEDAFDQLSYKITDSIQLQQKSGKVSRSVSARSKRPRIAKYDDLSNQGGYNDANGVFESVGSYLTNCELPGLYGLKSDNPDVTKYLDELSLDELLDLSYKSPSSGKDKTKRPANGNEKFLRTIKQACSVLELRKPGKSQVFSEVDGSSSRIMSPYSLSPASCVPNNTSLDKEDINMTDPSVHNKDFSNNSDAPPKKFDFSLLQPQDIFNRLALAPRKDLESLILDATKTGSISRNGFDSRLGKQTINRAGLPPFQWSHTYSGHLKTNLDATKLSSSRPTCQGKWHRIDDSCNLIGVVNASFKDLKSLTYDHSLVPFRELRSGVVRDETSLSPRTSLLQNEAGEPSSGLSLEATRLPTVEEGSPTSLAAAQILVNLATPISPPHNPSEVTKFLNEPSPKLMGTRRFEFIMKPKDFSDTPKSTSHNPLPKSRSKSMPSSKKRKLSNAHVDIKTPLNWIAPKSHRSLPSRSIKELKPEGKHHNPNNVKQQSSCLPLPPAANVSEKRKVIQIDWNRTNESKS